MAANSKKVEDIYMWLIKVLESCVTKEQHFTARKLVRRFQHEKMRTYYLSIDTETEMYNTEMYNKLDEAIRDNLNRIILGERITVPTEYPYNDPWWKSTPEDIKRWMELNDDHQKIIKYWNDRMTEPPPGS